MDVPAKMDTAGLSGYYSGLKDADRLILDRYLPKADASDGFHLFLGVIDGALDDENYRFAVRMCEDSYSIELDDVMEFLVIERIIQAYIGCERYDDAKAACERNLELFIKSKDAIIQLYDGKMDDLHFRNNYIDMIVGIDSNYDLADRMLTEYNRIGILSDEDLAYRRNSLKVHRLQKVFDGIYSFRPRDGRSAHAEGSCTKCSLRLMPTTIRGIQATPTSAC